MQGLIEEGEETIKEEADPEVKDAALIAAAQRVEHYEMAAYGTVRAYAKLLKESAVVKLLQADVRRGEGDRRGIDRAGREHDQCRGHMSPECSGPGSPGPAGCGHGLPRDRGPTGLMSRTEQSGSGTGDRPGPNERHPRFGASSPLSGRSPAALNGP